MQGTKLQQFVIEKLVNMKMQDIVTINVIGKSSITDYMIICTGTSNRHLISVANKLIKECRKIGVTPLGIEGQGISNWIVIDFNDIIIHIMQEDSRSMYELEKLWS